jgi:hypothetical protein
LRDAGLGRRDLPTELGDPGSGVPATNGVQLGSLRSARSGTAIRSGAGTTYLDN